jgi:hypothetical protein
MTKSQDPAWLEIGVAAELNRHYSRGAREFLELLALLLEDALPDETTVERRGGLLARKRVARLDVELDAYRYALEATGRGSLRATRTHIVRGIALKTEELAMPEWIAALGAALEARARNSAAAHEALARLLN